MKSDLAKFYQKFKKLRQGGGANLGPVLHLSPCLKVKFKMLINAALSVDTNILFYAMVESSQWHEKARCFIGNHGVTHLATDNLKDFDRCGVEKIWNLLNDVKK